MKICVYAICKNEMKFVNRWLDSLSKESDYIVLLDTGSTDGTYEYLMNDSRVTRVEQKIINPWRFDVARNESMKLIPQDTDICVVSDLDQTFRAGWGDELRKLFNEGYQEVYGDIIDYTDENEEIKRFLSKNVHPYSSEWVWERPIHEGLIYKGEKEINTIVSDSFVIEHHPDYSKSRGSYLDLLEKEYKENYKDPMCAIYYGCELCFNDRLQEGQQVFLKAFEECDFSSCPEIGYQIALNIADGYKEEGDIEKALHWAYEAYNFGIITRRIHMATATYLFDLKLYDECINYIEAALNLTYNARGWIESSFYWENGCYDLLSLALYEKREYLKAAGAALMYLETYPNDERVKNNLNYFLEAERKSHE